MYIRKLTTLYRGEQLSRDDLSRLLLVVNSEHLTNFRAADMQVLHRPTTGRLFNQLQCGPMPNVMVALPNIGGALCSTPQNLADAQYLTAVQ